MHLTYYYFMIIHFPHWIKVLKVNVCVYTLSSYCSSEARLASDACRHIMPV